MRPASQLSGYSPFLSKTSQSYLRIAPLTPTTWTQQTSRSQATTNLFFQASRLLLDPFKA